MIHLFQKKSWLNLFTKRGGNEVQKGTLELTNSNDGVLSGTYKATTKGNFGLTEITEGKFYVASSTIKDKSYAPKLTDIDGNSYKTTIYNHAIWMMKNLKTTRFADGSTIQLVEDKNNWTVIPDIIESEFLCFFIIMILR